MSKYYDPKQLPKEPINVIIGGLHSNNEILREEMNKKVKIKDKDYYCDMEVLKLIERLQDKVELLEYNRDKAIEYIEKNEFSNNDILFLNDETYYNRSVIDKIISILRGKDNE